MDNGLLKNTREWLNEVEQLGVDQAEAKFKFRSLPISTFDDLLELARRGVEAEKKYAALEAHNDSLVEMINRLLPLTMMATGAGVGSG